MMPVMLLFPKGANTLEPILISSFCLLSHFADLRHPILACSLVAVSVAAVVVAVAVAVVVVVAVAVAVVVAVVAAVWPCSVWCGGCVAWCVWL